MSDDLQSLITEMRQCRLCEADMERAPNPVFQLSDTATILVAGQAPGNLADTTGTPFNDPSGDRLRDWMGVSRDEFYDVSKMAILPMGFCFPGYDAKGGDLPPMKRCAEVWRHRVLEQMPQLELILLIGGYAQRWHLGRKAEKTLTATVANWKMYARDHMFTLPHPSWRNTAWLKRNPWFEADVLPELRRAVRSALSAS
ncbi:uracil-DNA glycosylase family protein [Hyphomonas sp.]|uniref:uracil-DNA glycosylase family protein n=1 Tax=Hyphomonas sp. TaxID=87 RepID=UPI000C450B66|nr:uracil-DNA glycosylase family protein [Hyphomonas sp.]MAB09773.1 uracil-DNA glycosylase [Hyphomonas sp.]MAU66732.1 uracil-DNA glycosylase [Hyphomonas sp.]MBM58231.1 uracil-DNA glycosylase [Hyphomonas sp.]